MFRKLVTTADGKVVYSNFDKKCILCIDSCCSRSEVIDCKERSEKRRRGKATTADGGVYLCTSSSDYLNSARLFKEKIAVFEDFFNELSTIKNEIKEEANKDSKRLIHNLTSLNAHNIQELYNLVPQDVLTEDYAQQIRIISEIIVQNPDEAAKMFIRIAKHNAAMKTEFSVFKKLYEPNPILQPKRHNVRKVVLNVLHTFFQDFTDNLVSVEVKHDASYLNFDYESVHVALYHIIENATKYTCPLSKLTISFVGNKTSFDVIFEMVSIKIEKNELGKITDEGYCGIHAKELSKNGSGIGLNRVKRILLINNAELIIRSNIKPNYAKQMNGMKYELNQFILRFNEISSLGVK